MPPKIKVTKEDIVNAALDIVRCDGVDSINARNVASKLGCSTQPVFSNFATIEELRFAVTEKAGRIFEEYLKREEESGEYPLYKASGMAYIRFAKEEKELFKLLYMRNRQSETISTDSVVNNKTEELVYRNTGLVGDDNKFFHLEMWAYVHGIATMLATDFIDLEWELISKMLTDSYQSMKHWHGTEGENGSDKNR